MMGLPLIITDVGPRDGLQSQSAQVSTEGKLQLITALWESGIRSIEVTSFVSPKAVPQMADAQQVLQGVTSPHNARVSVLVPNQRGLERAMETGAREIAMVLSATETMNQKNIRMGLNQTIQSCKEMLVLAQSAGLRTRVYVAVAFECPFEGRTPVQRVINLCQQMAEAGADEVVVADTIGAASPQDVVDLVKPLLRVMDSEKLSLHLHDTRGMALANAWAAIQLGIRRFDASVGGLGGCPFAPGAAGNLATEDLVLMATQCGLQTGIDLGKLMSAVDLAGNLVGYEVGGRSARWLRRQAPKPTAPV